VSGVKRTARQTLEQLIGNASVDLAEAERQLRAVRDRAPDRDSVDLAISTLDALLGRLLVAKQQLDTKAALIIPAIGAIGGLAVDRVAPNPTPLALLLGAIALITAGFAVLYAVIAVVASDHRTGPDAVKTALATSENDPVAYRQMLADSLALAVLDTKRLVDAKAARLNRGLLCAAAAVILLLAFVGAGGWK
jgi:hypothetical protein